jgi:hypothetical protein
VCFRNSLAICRKDISHSDGFELTRPDSRRGCRNDSPIVRVRPVRNKRSPSASSAESKKKITPRKRKIIPYTSSKQEGGEEGKQ